MIKISDKNIKIGDITIAPTVDVKLLKSLMNLEKGKIVPSKEGEEGLIGESLADFIYLPDAILHHERLVLPRPKEFYVKEIGEKLLDSDVINKLQENDIIYFPTEEAYDFGEVERLHGELTNLINKDPRVYLLALLAAPSSERASRWLKKHNFVNENSSFERYWAGGADAIVEWVNSVDINRLYAAIPENIADDRILSEKGVESSPGYAVFLTSHISVMEAGYYSQDNMFFEDIIKEKNREECGLVAKKLQRSFEKTTKRALQRVLGKLSEAKESIERDLIEEEYMTEKLTYKIPFSFGLLINEMNRKSDPVDLIDVAIKKRKKRGNKAFREWLREYDNEMRKDNPDRIKRKKIKDELDKVAANLREEYSDEILTKKIIQSTSNFGKGIAEMGIRSEMGDLSSTKKFLDASINFLELLYSKICFPYISYMQKLGTADINVLNKLKVDRVFGEQGKEFANILRYYSIVGKKADIILKMKRKTQEEATQRY